MSDNGEHRSRRSICENRSFLTSVNPSFSQLKLLQYAGVAVETLLNNHQFKRIRL